MVRVKERGRRKERKRKREGTVVDKKSCTILYCTVRTFDFSRSYMAPLLCALSLLVLCFDAANRKCST